MAQTHVQSTHSESFTGNSIILAFGSNNAAKNLLVYSVQWDRLAAGNASFSDSQGNSIVDSGNGIVDNAAGQKTQMVCVLAAKAGANTVTVSWSGAPAPTFGALVISEFNDSVNTGGWSLDQVAHATGNSTTPSSGNTPTTTNANEVVYGYCTTDSGDTITVGTGFTQDQTNQPTIGGLAEYKFVTSTGAQAATFNVSPPPNWTALCTTFFAPAAGGAGASTLPLMGVG